MESPLISQGLARIPDARRSVGAFAQPASPASPGSGDQVHLSGTTVPVGGPRDPNQRVLSNRVSLKPFQQGGQTTGVYATLPGGPGTLLGASILICLSITQAQNVVGGDFVQAQAYPLGADGKVLRDDEHQPKLLPATVMSDGRVYVQTDLNDPNAPLAMLDPDGSYGISTPPRLKVAGDTQGLQGYTREQSEFIKPDNTVGFRVHEDVGAISSPPGQFQQALAAGVGGLATALGLSGGGREVSYTEVQQLPTGPVARDVHFNQSPGQNWPQFSPGFHWSSLISVNSPDSRERTVDFRGDQIRLEGGWSGKRMWSLATGQSGMGMNPWTYGKQEAITFVPLSKRHEAVASPLSTAAAPSPAPVAPPPLPGDF